MSVSVVTRPNGYKIIDQALDAAIVDDGGFAKVNFAGHGLTTGDTVYIVSDIENYNGFVQVGVDDADNFFIAYGTSFIDFYQAISIQYYQTQSHDWSSIFLPIVYKLTNDKWPENSVDAVRTISSFSNDNGYTNIILSGALKASVRIFDYIKITGFGVYQIVEVNSTSNLVINLAYDASMSLPSTNAQFYYNNYQNLIRIYAGLESTHPWAAQKPMELQATIGITPDTDNVSMFSISDVIKNKVKVENNLLLFSLPLNLDAFTQFYIETAESYDESDGYAIDTYVSSFTEDTFKGYAITSQLPFKNVYSGLMSDYVYTSGSPARWLTNLLTLLGMDGYFFDISVILNDTSGDIAVLISKYVSDYLTAQETITLANQGKGVYRIPIELSSTYDRFCVQVGTYIGGTPGVPGWDPAAIPAIRTWGNVNTGGLAWTNPSDDTMYLDYSSYLGLEISDIIRTPYAFEAGHTYTFRFTFVNTRPSDPGQFCTLGIYDIGGTLIDSQPGTSNGTITMVRVATGSEYQIGCYYSRTSDMLGPYRVTLTLVENLTPSVPAIPPDPGTFTEVTEEICINVMDTCVDTTPPAPAQQFYRLLEDGSFRLLEDGGFRLLEE